MSQIFPSVNNSTYTPLGANATFVGVADNLTGWEEIDVNIAGAPYNAGGMFYFEFSPDNVNWDVSVPLTLTSLSFIPINLRAILPYFRIRYINGPIAQTQFRLTVMLHRTSSARLTRFLTQTIDPNEPVELTKSIIAGKSPDGDYDLLQINDDGYLLSDISDRSSRLLGVVYQGTSPWIVRDTVADGYLQSILANQTNGTQQVVVDGYVQTNPNVNVISFPNDVHVMVDGYVQTNPNVYVQNFPSTSGTVTANQGTPNTLAEAWPVDLTDGYGNLISAINPLAVSVKSFPADQHVIVDGYVQTNPNVNVINFPNDVHVEIDGYVQTNPNVNVINFPNDIHVEIDGYVQTNPNVNVINFPNDIHVMVDGYVQTNPNVNQGTPNTLSNAWPVEVTDGTNVLGTVAHPLQVNVDGYVQTNPNVNVISFPNDIHVVVDGYVQTNPNVNQGSPNTLTNSWPVDLTDGYGNLISAVNPLAVNVKNFPAEQHVVVDGYVQTNPNVNVINFPNDVHVEIDGYVQTNPNVNVVSFPNDMHVVVDGYVQTNPNVNQGSPNTLANAWPVEVTDGTNVLGTVAHPLQVNVDGYVQTNPNVNVLNFPANQTVSGTVTSNQGTPNTLVNSWPVDLTDGYGNLISAVNPLATQSRRSSTTTVTSVAASASNVSLLASNPIRLGATVINDSTSATLYLKLGTTASTSSYTVQVLPTGYYEVPFGYTGEIDGIWSAAVGNARITELTP